MRAQVSIEYIFLVGIIILITVPLFFYGISEANNNVRINQADDAISTLANAADTVYSLGPGSRKYVWISIPSGVRYTSVNGSMLLIQLSIFGGSTDVEHYSKAALVGSIPSAKGTYRMSVEALEAGVVRIGEEYNDTTPPIILRVYPYTLPDQFICPGFTIVGADTDEPSTCKYDTVDTDYDSMSSIFDGRALTHTVEIYTQPESNYTFYTKCMDTFGNKMTSSSIIFFQTSMPCGAPGTGNYTINWSDDVGPPEVHLIAPINNSFLNWSFVDFFWNVSDTNNTVLYCIIQADGIRDDGVEAHYTTYKVGIEQNVTLNASQIIDLGNYTWYVNCTDNSSNLNTGQSEIWSFRMNKTIFDSFLKSCAGQCGYNNYWYGNCRQNPSQCTVNNEIYLPAGNIYCSSGSTGDYCCCVPLG